MQEKKILFFDTETSGFPHTTKPYNEDCQPYMLQFAALQYSSKFDKIINKVSFIIKWPQEVDIASGALEVHNISNDIMSESLQAAHVMPLIWRMLETSDECIGFNTGFDKHVLATAFCRCAKEDAQAQIVNFIESTPFLDMMKPLTAVCKIPGKKGGYKWPKLSEAHKLLIGYEFDGAHDALADTEATFRLWKYCKQNLIKLEAV